MGKSLVEMAAEIIQAQSSSKNMSTEEITAALHSTFKTLQALQCTEMQAPGEGAAEGAAAKVTDLTADKSIQKNKIVCMECGQEFKMLSPKHLASHNLTGREYREKHGLKLRQPLCAKSLSANRKKAGKARGIPENLKKAIEAKKVAAENKLAAAKPATASPKKKAAAKKAPKKSA